MSYATDKDQEFEFTTQEAEGGSRLDVVLTARLGNISRSQVQALIQVGQLRTPQGSITDCSYRVKPGESYTVILPEVKTFELKPAAIPLDIRFEDEHMLVLNKAAGMAAHPGEDFRQDTLANALLAHCGEAQLSDIAGMLRLGIVHRLDKDTTGLMVAAKTNAAHQHLAKQIQERTLKRCYYAIVWGTPHHRAGTITGNIASHPGNRRKMLMVREGGKEAITHYEVKEVYGEGVASLVECRLQTGRTHQIRLHLTSQGHPLIGDPLYGGRNNKRKVFDAVPQEELAVIQGFDRQALHSWYIRFEHPVSGEWLEFEAAPSADFEKLRGVLKGLAGRGIIP